MLVIGFQDGQNLSFSHDIDVDPTIDSPRKIHDTLMKEANGITFTTILCVESDEVVEHFTDGEDYDLSVDEDDDDNDMSDDTDGDDDKLHEDDGDPDDD